MGLRKIFQQAAKTAFKVAGDAITPAVYLSVYDDGINEAESISVSLGIMFGDFSLLERGINPNIQPGDVTGLVIAAELPVIPKEGDKVTADGLVYWVKTYSADPVRATYKLHLRKP